MQSAQREVWLSRKGVGDEIDEDPYLGRKPSSGGAHGANRKRARLMVAQYDAHRARGDFRREQPARRLREAETRPHRRADLFGVGGSKIASGMMLDGSKFALERPGIRFSARRASQRDLNINAHRSKSPS